MTLPKMMTPEERILKRDPIDPEEHKRIIRTLNLKVTGQRMAILEALHSGKRAHVTAQEVFELVSKKDASLGFATVYRFLRKLTEAGAVTEVRMGGMPARYEVTPKGHHDHLTCTHCGKICEFENVEIEQMQNKVAEQFGFVLTNHVLELYGVCVECRKREARAGRS